VAPDTILDRSLDLVKVDFAPTHRQPSGPVVLATVVSLVGSLAVDAALVAIGEAVFPSTKGYVHFQFSDYSKLTIIGVIIACVAWPDRDPYLVRAEVALLQIGHRGHACPVAPRSLHLEAGSACQGGGRADVHAPGYRLGDL
jgi:hypothetical protein